MNALETIESELKKLNYKSEIRPSQFNNTDVLVFDYSVISGRYKGKTFKVGFSMQEEGYPEYPPHFIHICDIPNTHLTDHSKYDEGGKIWKVFSAPPSDLWDQLPIKQKNMKTFLHSHLARIWDQI